MFTNVKNDVMAGITVAVVALPLALAFGVSSGLGPIAGLYGAIFCGFFASLFGGTKAQVSGPTGPIMVVTASIIGTYGQEKAMAAMFLGGLLQIGLGLLGVGSLVKLIPYPVISGFMNGIAVIIILSQKDAFLAAPLIALITMLTIWLIPRFTQKIPSTLVALMVGTLFAIYVEDKLAGTWLVGTIQTIGDIPQGLPTLHLPKIHISDFEIILPMALTIAVLGSIDSLLTSIVVDNITDTKHNSNRELIGQGIGNAIASIFGGLVGAGATVRSVVNVKAGGRTPLSGITHSLTLLMVVLVLAPLASKISLACLAGILVMTGIGMFDYQSFKDIVKQPKADSLIMLTTFALTVAVDLMTAVGVGLVLASLVFVVRTSKLKVRTKSLDSLALPTEVLAKLSDAVAVYSIDGPLFFGTADSVTKGLLQVSNCSCLVIDLHHVEIVDATGASVLRDAIIKLKSQGKKVVICGIKEQVANTFQALGVIDVVGNNRCFSIASDAVKYLANAA